MVVVRRSCWLAGLGAGLAALGVLFACLWPTIFYLKIKNMMVLKDGSMSFEIWRDIPIPVYLECFLFNITNTEDILAKKADKVRVEQLGPYVFREIHKKVDIVWNENSTVTFKNQRWWYYEPEMSNGSLSDLVTTINPIVVTIAYTVRNDSLMLRMIVDMVMRGYHSDMFLTANASSWLFDGVQIPILDFASRLPAIPYNIPFDKFGWFYTRNGSTSIDGEFVTNTGETDFSKLGHTELWRHSTRTVFGGGCGEVRGTTGELWALSGEQQQIQLFAADLCTYITLKKTGPVVLHGVPGVEFAADDSLFDNGHKYPNMACYCEEGNDKECMGSGVLNVSGCHFGAPAFITRPHFQGVGSTYRDKIEGLRPTDQHNFKMAIEPITGMPLYVSAQLQANALVRHIPGISLNNQLPDPEVLVPMFWFREEIEMNEEYTNFAQMALDVRKGMAYGFYILIITGAAMLCVGLWWHKFAKSPTKTKKEQDKKATQAFIDKSSVI